MSIVRLCTTARQRRHILVLWHNHLAWDVLTATSLLTVIAQVSPNRMTDLAALLSRETLLARGWLDAQQERFQAVVLDCRRQHPCSIRRVSLCQFSRIIVRCPISRTVAQRLVFQPSSGSTCHTTAQLVRRMAIKCFPVWSGRLPAHNRLAPGSVCKMRIRQPPPLIVETAPPAHITRPRIPLSVLDKATRVRQAVLRGATAVVHSQITPPQASYWISRRVRIPQHTN
mmetsp:Transcript_16215/g.49303  ORF Transcript_16215/g.49303 Transcript_16215/m.49303 type:complete len:228 (-) Transcript_16215:3790-4473(-)